MRSSTLLNKGRKRRKEGEEVIGRERRKRKIEAPEDYLLIIVGVVFYKKNNILTLFLNS